MLIVLLGSPVEAQLVSRALGQPIAWQVIQDGNRPTVSGTVVGPTGSGQPGALVSIGDRGTGAITRDDGSFEIEAPPPGEWILLIGKIGFESLQQEITVLPNASVKIAAILARPQAICTNACVGTGCDDLNIVVIDSITGRRPEVSIRLIVEHEGRIEESITRYDPDSPVTTAWVGLGHEVRTVGWHTIEIQAEGYLPWRKERVWLEVVPWCHGELLGRTHRAGLLRR